MSSALWRIAPKAEANIMDGKGKIDKANENLGGPWRSPGQIVQIVEYF
jgi:hypothetical protein